MLEIGTTVEVVFDTYVFMGQLIAGYDQDGIWTQDDFTLVDTDSPFTMIDEKMGLIDICGHLAEKVETVRPY